MAKETIFNKISRLDVKKPTEEAYYRSHIQTITSIFHIYLDES